MLGNETIAKILENEYGFNDLTPYEEIDYQIEQYTDEISRVKITSRTDRNFCCPVYAMFDGYHMSWYGDYGFWGFCCTWKTNLMNLAYNSPYYQLEKLESRERKEFNDEKCASRLLKLIKEGDWYTSDLSEDQKKRFDEFITSSYDYIYSDDVLYEYEEICAELKTLYNATQDKFEWFSALRKLDFENDPIQGVFDCEAFELYDIGEKAPSRFFVILYMLSVVATKETEKLQQKGENNNE